MPGLLLGDRGAGGHLPGGGESRIQALEQKGIIEEYTTIVNPQKISGAVSCYFEIETQPETLAEVIETLRQNETVTQIYRVTGRDKLHVHAVAASGEEMERLMREVIDPCRGWSGATATSSCPGSRTSRACGCEGRARLRPDRDLRRGKDHEHRHSGGGRRDRHRGPGGGLSENEATPSINSTTAPTPWTASGASTWTWPSWT